MPPEQVSGRQVDHRADLFSAGVVLYVMLTGRLPFDANTPAAVVRQIVYAPPLPPLDYNSGIPAEVIDVLDKSLAKDPDERYQSASEMRDDIQRFFSLGSVGVRKTTILSSLSKRSDRRKKRVVFAALALAAIALIIGSVWMKGKESAAPPPTERKSASVALAVFDDPALESAVCERLGKNERDLTVKDLLKLSDLNVPDMGIASLKGLESATQMRDLSLNGNAISDLAPLANMKHMLCLHLDRNRGIGGGQARHLENMSGLEDLAVYDTSIGDADLESIGKIASLRSLLLGGSSNISDEGLAFLKGLQRLEQITLGNTPITDAGLRNLAELTSLRAIDLTGCGSGITDAGLAELARIKDLGILRLSQTAVGGKGLSALQSLTQLETLDLSGARVTDDGLKSLAGHPSLRFLSLSGCFRISDAGMRGLSTLPGLEGLDLTRCNGVGADGFELAERMTGLRELHIGESPLINDSAIEQIKDCPNLAILAIRGNPPLTPSALDHLGEMSSLQLLWLPKAFGDAKELDELRQLLPRCVVKIDIQTLLSGYKSKKSSCMQFSSSGFL